MRDNHEIAWLADIAAEVQSGCCTTLRDSCICCYMHLSCNLIFTEVKILWTHFVKWPLIHWVPGVLSSVAKYLVCEYDRSPLWPAEVKNEWSHASALPVFVHGLDRDSFAHFMFSVCVLHVLQFLRYLTSDSDWAIIMTLCILTW